MKARRDAETETDWREGGRFGNASFEFEFECEKSLLAQLNLIRSLHENRGKAAAAC